MAETQPSRSATKERAILGGLQQRLFDGTRRNRLLHFRPTTASVNLSLASIPLEGPPEDVPADAVLTCDERFLAVLRDKPVLLNEHVDFAQAAYMPIALNRIRLEARRDLMEFGTAQLRLAVVFLSWTQLKVEPIERFESPLLLMPVELTREKGVRDSYWVRAVSEDLELNPVIRRLFEQQFGWALPETVECRFAAIVDLQQRIGAWLSVSGLSVELECVDRPDIASGQALARRRLAQYQRRRCESNPPSPAREDVAPIESGTSVSETRAVRDPMTSAPEPAPSREDGPNRDDPYAWKLDLTNVTLANFRYQRMSLVRDYDELIAECPDAGAFQSTFRLAPKPVDSTTPISTIDSRFDVLPTDPTQVAAVARARTGDTYIIQGPPGTGKSQTIANLIVDFVANGKRVLFVCAKRAAIDVVYARLKQKGLHGLCCLIHDSQIDKKAFVLELRDTYEKFLGVSQRRAPSRDGATRRLSEAIASLGNAERVLAAAVPSASISARRVIERLVDLRRRGVVRDGAPAVPLADFLNAESALGRFRTLLERVRPDGVLARHPLRLSRADFATDPEGESRFDRALDSARRACRESREAWTAAGLPEKAFERPELEAGLLMFAGGAAGLLETGGTDLLSPGSERSRRLDALRAEMEDAETLLSRQAERNAGWKFKLTPDDTRRAVDVERALASSPFRWFKPAWWRLRATLSMRYDFARHAIQPSWAEVLDGLAKEHAFDAARVDLERRIIGEFPHAKSGRELLERVAAARRAEGEVPEDLREPLTVWLGRDDLAKRAPLFRIAAEKRGKVDAALSDLLSEVPGLTLPSIQELIEAMAAARSELPRFLDCLRALADLPPSVAAALRGAPVTVGQLEAGTLAASVDGLIREAPWLRDWTSDASASKASELADAYEAWLDANASHVAGQAMRLFRECVARADAPATGADSDEKARRKNYLNGRRDLEREFAKSTRFRSIRELVSGPTADVVRDLKPVWLMSPLSVSDALPLTPDAFDVVIFDEASQITLEEAVPTLFRAKQAIVVGDEMQLPPTSFFQKRDEEELDVEWTEDDAVNQYDLASESLLNHASRHLPSTMLGWHYRSRNESLIAFSNAAFYGGRLLTVPEEQLASAARPRLAAASATDAAANADSLFDRPISFHRMTHAVYEDRVNPVESAYVAELIRDVLRRRNGWTIAVIAFSEAQQTRIEEAIDELARSDDAFRESYEAECEREIDGQFVGLIIKNLENIQGDERDLVILSVCYGPNSTGAMRMLFGPINASGGERRLNVAFTRAKRHMAVIASFDDAAITNDHNVGAKCLKQYLRYASAVSIGETSTSDRVLRDFRHASDAFEHVSEEPNASARELAEELAKQGWACDFDIGHSQFQVDLAVRKPGENAYRLALLFDRTVPIEGRTGQAAADGRSAAELSLLEFRVQRPRLLEAFGWKVRSLVTLDWLRDRAGVLERVLNDLASDSKDSK